MSKKSFAIIFLCSFFAILFFRPIRYTYGCGGGPGPLDELSLCRGRYTLAGRMVEWTAWTYIERRASVEYPERRIWEIGMGDIRSALFHQAIVACLGAGVLAILIRAGVQWRKRIYPHRR